ncbi:hypothetical protein NX722_25265 [Endozoicomonas gorgoniicola]|uniref:DUF615 domain-containing protein n=1 Tax=Endozoicomonas gorgoniicola TaxID=1234144 RepID=A0ABT3N2L4_9GAMM|nr:hypothetical protein [Endozoicomonas gorgoniicola]MCW7555877.1 hypothetical protein [Endozoicomonas gorgoniicola]
MSKADDLKEREQWVLDALYGLKAGEMLKVLNHASLAILNKTKSEQFRGKPDTQKHQVRRRLSEIEKDPEVAAFIKSNAQHKEQAKLLRQMKVIFKERCPSQSALSRYLTKCRRQRAQIKREAD